MAFMMSDLLVTDKAGAIFSIEPEEVSDGSPLQVGTLRRRIRSNPTYENANRWHFLGEMDAAKDDESILDYVDPEKEKRIVVVRSWKSWYGTFLEEQLLRKYPRMSYKLCWLIMATFSLAFVPLIVGFSKASFTLHGGDVPYTLQTLGVFFAAFFLGVWSVLSVGVYLALGAAGLPVFSESAAGPHFLTTSPTAGFLWGFLLVAFFCRAVGVLARVGQERVHVVSRYVHRLGRHVCAWHSCLCVAFSVELEFRCARSTGAISACGGHQVCHHFGLHSHDVVRVVQNTEPARLPEKHTAQRHQSIFSSSPDFLLRIQSLSSSVKVYEGE